MRGRLALLAAASLGAGAVAAAAPEPVTIRADGPSFLHGTVASGQPGEIVTVEAKDCGVYPQRFRELAEAHTSLGGRWGLAVGTGVTSTLRAVWKGKASRPIVVWQRPLIRLQPVASRTAWRVTVVGRTQFWRKRVRFERWDRFRSRWVLVRWVTLTDVQSPAGAAFAQSTARFRARVAAGTLVRGVLPRSQSGPCYLAGFSRQFRA